MWAEISILNGTITGACTRLFVLIKQQQSVLSDIHSNHKTSNRVGLQYAIYIVCNKRSKNIKTLVNTEYEKRC